MAENNVAEEIRNPIEFFDRERIKELGASKKAIDKFYQNKKKTNQQLAKNKEKNEKQEIIKIARTKKIPLACVQKKNLNHSKQEKALDYESKTYSDEIRYTQLKKKCKECFDSYDGECFSCSTREEILKLDPYDPDHHHANSYSEEESYCLASDFFFPTDDEFYQELEFFRAVRDMPYAPVKEQDLVIRKQNEKRDSSMDLNNFFAFKNQEKAKRIKRRVEKSKINHGLFSLPFSSRKLFYIYCGVSSSSLQELEDAKRYVEKSFSRKDKNLIVSQVMRIHNTWTKNYETNPDKINSNDIKFKKIAKANIMPQLSFIDFDNSLENDSEPGYIQIDILPNNLIDEGTRIWNF